MKYLHNYNTINRFKGMRFDVKSNNNDFGVNLTKIVKTHFATLYTLYICVTHVVVHFWGQ